MVGTSSGGAVHLGSAPSARRQGLGGRRLYDGCLLYDFTTKRLAVFDLDHYRQGPYENTVGRVFGSTRFMAPEEFERGRVIDERTTVFALARSR